jgi:hypothetical protein
MDDSSSLSSGTSSDDNGNTTVKEEELVTKWRLRLSAYHLPKRGGIGLKSLMKTSPDTYATVASIVRKTGTLSSRTYSPLASNSFDYFSDDYMVGWGSTEV